MSKIARNEQEVCGGLARGVGERSTGGKSTFVGPSAGSGGTVDVAYSPSDVTLVDIGKPNPAMMRNSNKKG